MAKDQSNVLKAATGYLNGKIEDTETEVGEELNNDIVQFFAKLMDLAGLTFNGNYDNETNDYQFIEALQTAIGGFVKIINIGDWNMLSTGSVVVAHGLTFDKIIDVNATILIDDDSGGYPLASPLEIASGILSGSLEWDNTNVTLEIPVDSHYRSVNYDKTSYNRGYVIIRYLP